MRVCNRRVKEGAEDEVSLALSAGYLHTAPDLFLHLSEIPIVSQSSPVALTLAH